MELVNTIFGACCNGELSAQSTKLRTPTMSGLNDDKARLKSTLQAVKTKQHVSHGYLHLVKEDVPLWIITIEGILDFRQAPARLLSKRMVLIASR